MKSVTPLIANPTAGGGRCGRHLAEAVARLEEGGLAIEVHPTTGPRHATSLAERLWSEGHRTLLVAGGDGTTFEVVDGLFRARGPDDPVPRLGLLPLGTGNSFLRDLDVLDAETALAAVIRGSTRPVDVIRCTHDDGVLHYLNLFSIGFTSRVGATTNRWFKSLGAAGYALATVIETVRLAATPIPHRLDDGPWFDAPLTFLSLSNSRCTGGAMQMAPGARVDDGLLDIVRIGVLGRVGLLRLFPRIYEGAHLDHPANSATAAKRVDLALPGPTACMIDGEVLTLRPTALEVLPHAVEVFA